MKRVKKHRALSEEEMAQLKIKPQWWIDKMNDAHKNPRDTQFAGFAKLLWEEIGKMEDAFCEECGTGPHSLARDMERAETLEKNVELLIARRAYDFVGHMIDYVDAKDLDMLERHECIERIPDLTEWPGDP